MSTTSTSASTVQADTDSTSGPGNGRWYPFSPAIAAVALVLGAGGNTLQAVLGQLNGGRPSEFADQVVWADQHTAQFVAICLAGTLAVPFMAIGFLAACRLLARRARRTAVVAGVLLMLGMWGFQVIQAAELIQLAAILDTGGYAAAEWMHGLSEQPLLIVFGAPFMVGTPIGMLVLIAAALITGALPRWISACWLAFILLDFSIGAVGPIDPHWLYLAGAIGLAAHLMRDGGRVWRAA